MPKKWSGDDADVTTRPLSTAGGSQLVGLVPPEIQRKSAKLILSTSNLSSRHAALQNASTLVIEVNVLFALSRLSKQSSLKSALLLFGNWKHDFLINIHLVSWRQPKCPGSVLR